MTSTGEKITFSVEEVCHILSVCAEVGVTEMKLGDLQVSFTARKASEPYKTPLARAAAAEIAALQEKTAKQSLEEDEIRLREQQLAEMPITDPLLYEELLASGDLDGGSDESSEEAHS